MEINEPNCPDDTAVTIHGDKIAFLSLRYDQLMDSPSEIWECLGQFHSLSTRHINFNANAPDVLRENTDAVPLSYFEHGQCRWAPMGSISGMPDFRWDGVEFAGVWEPPECMVEEANNNELLGNERRAFFLERATYACETYTDWCNGSVYYVDAKIYKLRQEGENVFDDEDDYRFDDPVYEDGYGGIYGIDASEAAMKEMVTAVEAELNE